LRCGKRRLAQKDDKKKLAQRRKDAEAQRKKEHCSMFPVRVSSSLLIFFSARDIFFLPRLRDMAPSD
jgi:hypothetical protein